MSTAVKSDINPYQAPAGADADTFPVDAAAGQQPFLANDGRAQVTVVFLFISLGLSALSAIIGLGSFLTMPGPAGEVSVTAAWFSLADGAVAVLSLLTLIGCAIAFCMWFYRAYCNLRALGHDYLEHSPGWAPGSFFVPFINLVRPHSIAREIWVKSNPDLSGVVLKTPLVNLWWGFFLSSNILSNIGARLTRGEALLRAGTLTLVVADLLLVGAGLAAIKMVRGIQLRQSRRQAALAGD